MHLDEIGGGDSHALLRCTEDAEASDSFTEEEAHAAHEEIFPQKSHSTAQGKEDCKESHQDFVTHGCCRDGNCNDAQEPNHGNGYKGMQMLIFDLHLSFGHLIAVDKLNEALHLLLPCLLGL